MNDIDELKKEIQILRNQLESLAMCFSLHIKSIDTRFDVVCKDLAELTGNIYRGRYEY